MPIQFNALYKTAAEVVTYIFDFSNFPEVLNGETLSSPSVTATGLTVGTPTILSVKLDGVPSGQGVKVTISGGTAGTTYNVSCQVNTSGGDVRVVKGQIIVE